MNASPSSNPNLPLYEDIIPGSSTSLCRRGSDGDMHEQAHMEKPRSRSNRSQSMRKVPQRRMRPEITIVSSQPMRNHPAFADGAKGSCVPPEAPPSYDEAMKSSNTRPLSADTPEQPIHHRRDYRNRQSSAVNPEERVIQSRPVPTNLGQQNCGIEAARASSSSALRQQSGLVVLSTHNRNFNRNHNNSDELTRTAASTPHRQSSVSRTEPVATSHHSNRLASNPRTPNQGSSSSVPSVTASNPPKPAARQGIKPPIPHKRAGLTAVVSSRRAEATRSKTLSSVHTGSFSMAANSDNANLKEINTDQAKTAPRKLPPPPRPPAFRKKVVDVTRPEPGTAAAVDENTSHSKINETKPKSGDIDDSVLGSEENLKSTKLNDDESSQHKNVEGALITESGEDIHLPEPTYASINKSTTAKKKKVLEVKQHLDHHEASVPYETTNVEDKSVEQSPPPIPQTRPPPEDYDGIFSSTFSTDTTIENDCSNKMVDFVFKADKDHTEPERRNGLEITSRKDIDVPPTQKSDEDAFGDPSENEPEYEQIFFETRAKERRVSAPAAPRMRAPPTKPRMRPPPRPPVVSSNSNTSKDNTVSFMDNNTGVKKDNPTPKTLNLIEPNSQHFNEKSSPDENHVIVERSFEDQKNIASKSTLTPKAKSFSHADQKEGNSSQIEKQFNNSRVNPSRKVSTPSDQREKPKRFPPPRPAIPLVLQKKLLSQGSRFDQGTAPPCKNATKKPSSPVSDTDVEHTYTAPIQLYSQPTLPLTETPRPPLRKPPPPPTRPPLSKRREEIPLRNPTSNDTLKVAPAYSIPIKDRHLQECNETQANNITNGKPARPPPLKVGQGHQKKVATTKQDKVSTEKTENDESFLDVVLSTEDASKSKASVDNKMKEYITDESYYIATQDYHPDNFTDLSFSAGEKILVMRQIDDELLFGRNEEGEEGSFPQRYVSLEANQSNSNSVKLPQRPVRKPTNSANCNNNNRYHVPIIGKAIALHDYTGRNEDELSFITGSEIDVVGNVGNEWLRGKIDQKLGMFPRNFVSFTPLRVNIGRDRSVEMRKNSKRFAVTLYEFTGVHSNELSLNVGDQVEVLCRVDDEWLQGRCKGKTGIFPSAFVNLPSANVPFENEAFSPLLDNLKSDAKSFQSVGSIDAKYQKVHSVNIEKKRRVTAVALYGFIGQDDSELTFNTQDVIAVTERVNDEWFRGELNGKSGIFPTNHVKISSPTQQ